MKNEKINLQSIIDESIKEEIYKQKTSIYNFSKKECLEKIKQQREEDVDWVKNYAKNHTIKKSDLQIVQDEIDLAISDFMKKNKDIDIKNTDIIVKKINGKYVAYIDNKREDKLKEIFKDNE